MPDLETQALIAGLQQRIAVLERVAPDPPTQTGDFMAKEGQCIVVSPFSKGLTALLPQARTMNKGKRVQFFQKTPNKVTLRAAAGKVNGVPFVVSNAVGFFEAISDGETGWSVAQSITVSGVIGAPGTPGSGGLQGAPGIADLEAALYGGPVFALAPPGAAGAVGATGPQGPPVLPAITEPYPFLIAPPGLKGDKGDTGATGASGSGSGGSSPPPLPDQFYDCQQGLFVPLPPIPLPQGGADVFLGHQANTGTLEVLALSGLAGSGLGFAGHALRVNVGPSMAVVANTVVREALTGAITAAQDSNATAFGTLAAKSVLANATNAVAVPAALAGSAAFQHLRVNSANNALEWSVLTTGDFPAGSVPISALAAFPTWAQALAAGNTTGANTPVFEGAAQWTDSTGVTVGGKINSTAAGNGVTFRSDGANGLVLTAQTGGRIQLGSTDALNPQVTAGNALEWVTVSTPPPTPASARAGLWSQAKPSGASVGRPTWVTSSGVLTLLDATAVSVLSAPASISNSVTNLTIGGFGVEASLFDVGSMYEFYGFIVMTQTVAPPTLTLEVLIDSTVVASAVCANVATAATFSGEIRGVLTCLSIGASGTFLANCQFCYNGGANFANALNASINTAAFGTTFSTTVARTVSMRVRMTTAVLGNTLVLSNARINRVR